VAAPTEITVRLTNSQISNEQADGGSKSYRSSELQDPGSIGVEQISKCSI